LLKYYEIYSILKLKSNTLAVKIKTISKNNLVVAEYYSRFNTIYFSEIDYLVQGGGFLNLLGKSGLHSDSSFELYKSA
jgi:hypothetical protein